MILLALGSIKQWLVHVPHQVSFGNLIAVFAPITSRTRARNTRQKARITLQRNAQIGMVFSGNTIEWPGTAQGLLEVFGATNNSFCVLLTQTYHASHFTDLVMACLTKHRGFLVQELNTFTRHTCVNDTWLPHANVLA